MKTCPTCGITMESEYSSCPLCQSDFNEPHTPAKPAKPSYPGMGKPLSRSERINLFWELMGILHFSSLLVVFFIDLFMNRRPGWSWFAISGIAASFIYITLIVFWPRKPFLLLGGLFLTTCSLLFTIDILHEGLSWFLVPALPLTGFLILFAALVVLFARLTHHRGLNIIATISIAVGAYVIVIDMSTNWMHNHNMAPTWSVIVALSILPFALFLLYFHYRLKRGTSLRKFFHL